MKENSMQLLHAAAARGDVATCEVLLQQGAPANALSSEGMTALHHAVDSRNLAVCACLIQAGALFSFAPEHRDPTYRTPFQYALDRNWREGVRFFLGTQGGDPCAARIWQRSS